MSDDSYGWIFGDTSCSQSESEYGTNECSDQSCDRPGACKGNHTYSNSPRRRRCDEESVESVYRPPHRKYVDPGQHEESPEVNSSEAVVEGSLEAPAEDPLDVSEDLDGIVVPDSEE